MTSQLFSSGTRRNVNQNQVVVEWTYQYTAQSGALLQDHVLRTPDGSANHFIDLIHLALNMTTTGAPVAAWNGAFTNRSAFFFNKSYPANNVPWATALFVAEVMPFMEVNLAAAPDSRWVGTLVVPFPRPLEFGKGNPVLARANVLASSNDLDVFMVQGHTVFTQQ